MHKHWCDKDWCLLLRPESTPYSGGCFQFDIFFPSSYPKVPPMVNLQVRAFSFPLHLLNLTLIIVGTLCTRCVGFCWHVNYEQVLSYRELWIVEHHGHIRQMCKLFVCIVFQTTGGGIVRFNPNLYKWVQQLGTLSTTMTNKARFLALDTTMLLLNGGAKYKIYLNHW